jgi:hypothetical protein
MNHRQVWKSHGSLLHIRNVTENKLKIEDQLRVRIALKVMRKAYVKGSKIEREK